MYRHSTAHAVSVRKTLLVDVEVVELPMLEKLAKPVLEVVVALILAAVVTEKGVVVNAAKGKALLDGGILVSDLNAPKGSKVGSFEALAPPTNTQVMHLPLKFPNL